MTRDQVERAREVYEDQLMNGVDKCAVSEHVDTVGVIFAKNETRVRKLLRSVRLGVRHWRTRQLPGDGYSSSWDVPLRSVTAETDR